MPPVSQAQRRWAWANRNKRGKLGKAAREFAKADPGGKLPARVHHPDQDTSSHEQGDASWGADPYRKARRKALYTHPRSPRGKSHHS